MSDLAFYAIVISSSFFALTSLPQVFKPLEMGPKMYMTKLTSDKKALSQLTSLSMMWPVSVMQLCAVSIVGAFFGLTAPFVAVVAAFFATQLITFPTYVWGSAGEYIGMNKQMVIPQIAVMGSVLGMLVYSLFGDLTAMPDEPLSLNAKIMVGFNAFYVLANLPGIFAPAFLGSQYFPGAFPKEKYAAAHAVLEGALAHNFALKDAPVFQLVKARVLQTQGEHAEALALLQAAYALPGVRAADGAAAPADLSEHDRCSIHLHLAEVHRIARSRRHEPAPTPSSLPAPASAPRRSASHLAGPDRYGRCTRRCRSRRRRRP